MLRFIAFTFFVLIGSTAFAQTYSSPEATSATDGEVRIHKAKKSRFSKSTRARKSERMTEPVKESSRFQASRVRTSERITEPTRSRFQGTTARKSERITEPSRQPKFRASEGGTERHGKSMRKSRGSRKPSGESRVFRKHTPSLSDQGTKRSKVKRALGRSNF